MLGILAKYDSIVDDDYQIALKLQQEYDEKNKPSSETSRSFVYPVSLVDMDDDYALALQLQMEEERLSYSQHPKKQESTKSNISYCLRISCF